MRYNPKPFERLLTRYLAKQSTLLTVLIDEAVTGAVRAAGRVANNQAGDFFFRDYPSLSREVDSILRSLSSKITRSISSGIEWSWDLANVKNDDLLASVVKSIGAGRIPDRAWERWHERNLAALSSFQTRKVAGLGLSDRVWKYTSGMKGDIELALDLGLGDGKSADALSRAVRQYLHEPSRLYRRVRDEKGVLRLSQSAANYHPGQGVYRSSYKNARRLAATETNMAYRTSDFERAQQLDFFLGIEVHLSNNHTCLNSKGVPEPFYDICDELEGRYPKDFKFTGWHPLCRCYTTTILPSKDEFMDYVLSMDENGQSSYKFSGQVEDVPPQFKEWVSENEERAVNAKSLPYFIKDNPQYIQSGAIREKIPGADAEDIDSGFAKALGVKKGKPMSREDADNGRENPNYDPSVRNEYRVNCQTCTFAHEARRRGFDIEAAGKNSKAPDDYQSDKWNQRFLNPDGTPAEYNWSEAWGIKNGRKNFTEKAARDFVNEMTEQTGRYEMYVKWKGSKSAHVFIVERDAGRKLLMFDPQTGRSDVSDYLSIADRRLMAILRIDDKMLNPKAASILLPKAGK